VVVEGPGSVVAGAGGAVSPRVVVEVGDTPTTSYPAMFAATWIESGSSYASAEDTKSCMAGMRNEASAVGAPSEACAVLGTN
jgi:hypothetical protein